jgi:dihydroorotase
MQIAKIALQYVQDFDGFNTRFSQDENIKGNGVANEGIVSTRLGRAYQILPKNYKLQEIYFCWNIPEENYIPTISTKKSVQLIKEAKSQWSTQSCSVAVHHLVLTDEN